MPAPQERHPHTHAACHTLMNTSMYRSMWRRVPLIGSQHTPHATPPPHHNHAPSTWWGIICMFNMAWMRRHLMGGNPASRKFMGPRAIDRRSVTDGLFWYLFALFFFLPPMFLFAFRNSWRRTARVANMNKPLQPEWGNGGAGRTTITIAAHHNGDTSQDTVRRRPLDVCGQADADAGADADHTCKPSNRHRRCSTATATATATHAHAYTHAHTHAHARTSAQQEQASASRTSTGVIGSAIEGTRA